MDLKILRILKKPNNQPGSSFEIAFTDTFGEKAKLLMPRKIIQSKTESKKWLLDHNFPNQDTNGWLKIFEILQAKEPTNNFGMLVNKTGFWEKGYLLPNGTFIGSKEKYDLFLESELTKYLPDCSISGSLDDWKKTIAPAALRSSRIMLAICNAISGYLLKITGIENGGFHNFGHSSIGKTTLIRCALSVSGPDTNMQSWNSTESALEEIAFARNGGIICLDELKTADPNPKTAAQITSAIVYKLSMGQGKATSNKYNDSEQYNWHIVILSTGEDSLAKHAKSGGIKRKPGEEVRMIDVPADAGQGWGIFETLPKEFANNAGDCAKYLADQVQHCHGVAQIAFLERLIADLNAENPKTSVKDKLTKWMEKFRIECGVDQKSGTEVRFANRFALACAAGCLAVNYDILPFSRQDVFNGIAVCYKAALAVKPENWEEQLIRHEEKLAEYLKSKGFPALNSKDTWSKKETEKYDGFSHTINDIQMIVLKPDVVKSLIPEFYLKDVLSIFRSKGYLLSDANGNNTRSITLNGEKVRFYCFVSPGDDESIEAVRKKNQGYAAKKSSK